MVCCLSMINLHVIYYLSMKQYQPGMNSYQCSINSYLVGPDKKWFSDLLINSTANNGDIEKIVSHLIIQFLTELENFWTPDSIVRWYDFIPTWYWFTPKWHRFVPNSMNLCLFKLAYTVSISQCWHPVRETYQRLGAGL